MKYGKYFFADLQCNNKNDNFNQHNNIGWFSDQISRYRSSGI